MYIPAYVHVHSRICVYIHIHNYVYIYEYIYIYIEMRRCMFPGHGRAEGFLVEDVKAFKKLKANLDVLSDFYELEIEEVSLVGMRSLDIYTKRDDASGGLQKTHPEGPRAISAAVCSVRPRLVCSIILADVDDWAY